MISIVLTSIRVIVVVFLVVGFCPWRIVYVDYVPSYGCRCIDRIVPHSLRELNWGLSGTSRSSVSDRIPENQRPVS